MPSAQEFTLECVLIQGTVANGQHSNPPSPCQAQRSAQCRSHEWQWLIPISEVTLVGSVRVAISKEGGLREATYRLVSLGAVVWESKSSYPGDWVHWLEERREQPGPVPRRWSGGQEISTPLPSQLLKRIAAFCQGTRL